MTHLHRMRRALASASCMLAAANVCAQAENYPRGTVTAWVQNANHKIEVSTLQGERLEIDPPRPPVAVWFDTRWHFLHGGKDVMVTIRYIGEMQMNPERGPCASNVTDHPNSSSSRGAGDRSGCVAKP